MPRAIHGSLFSILHAIELERTEVARTTQGIQTYIVAIGVTTSTGQLHRVRFRPGTLFRSMSVPISQEIQSKIERPGNRQCVLGGWVCAPRCGVVGIIQIRAREIKLGGAQQCASQRLGECLSVFSRHSRGPPRRGQKYAPPNDALLLRKID